MKIKRSRWTEHLDDLAARIERVSMTGFDEDAANFGEPQPSEVTDRRLMALTAILQARASLKVAALTMALVVATWAVAIAAIVTAIVT